MLGGMPPVSVHLVCIIVYATVWVYSYSFRGHITWPFLSPPEPAVYCYCQKNFLFKKDSLLSSRAVGTIPVAWSLQKKTHSRQQPSPSAIHPQLLSVTFSWQTQPHLSQLQFCRSVCVASFPICFSFISICCACQTGLVIIIASILRVSFYKRKNKNKRKHNINIKTSRIYIWNSNLENQSNWPKHNYTMAKTSYQLRFLPDSSIKAIRPKYELEVAQHPLQARACGSTKSCMYLSL